VASAAAQMAKPNVTKFWSENAFNREGMGDVNAMMKSKRIVVKLVV
jgi:hypothetical protein